MDLATDHVLCNKIYRIHVYSVMLRHARKRAGLTQAELSRRSGIPQPAIARIEGNKTVPRIDTLDRLLTACEMQLAVVPLEGAGIDRSGIREMLKLSPLERLELAAKESSNLAPLTRRLRR